MGTQKKLQPAGRTYDIRGKLGHKQYKGAVVGDKRDKDGNRASCQVDPFDVSLVACVDEDGAVDVRPSVDLDSSNAALDEGASDDAA